MLETQPSTEPEVLGASALFSFEGRINRGTFWKIIVLNFVLGALTTAFAFRNFASGAHSAMTVAITALGGLVSGWMNLATFAKRWHDLDKSGLRALLNMIPLVNFFAFLYLGFTDGKNQPNQYGDDAQDIRLW